MTLTVQSLFDNLWKQYVGLNKTAEQIHSLLKSKNNNEILNDHVAFRTFKHPQYGISHLAKTFEQLGYKDMGDYHFEVKKLYAKHYEHPDKNLPKVFISELLTENFSSFFQNTFLELAKSMPEDQRNDPGVSYSGTHWNKSFDVYKKLYAESPYGAWLYAFGFCANHFTVYLNSLNNFSDLSELNQFLKDNNFILNASGGEIKGSPELFLEQSSTMANEIMVSFTDGDHKIPSCYYEFAKRYNMPDGKIYQGFVANSADKIFESTNKLN